MADRFPAIEDFDSEAQTESQGVQGNDASAADENFLDRERALLGEDAGQFASANDTTAYVEDDDDLLGGGGNDDSGAVQSFQSSFPAIDNEDNGPSGGITTTTYNSGYQTQSSEPEAEIITQWRERRHLALEERAEKSEQKKQETIKAAQENIDDFYENYNSKKEKTISQTRKDAEEFLAKRDDTTSGGTSWERIAKLVDLSGKGAKGGASGTGKERFRELLTGLRKDEKAPGASGV